ncbi:hypothetical protein CDAR_257531 [Caerostris darwini]|uniref:Uncharacterized protein n=1 Tax=Caerostris darwini TaxID=1538125 RepID=A0AAV4TEQ9_9ARAC|nr:hypothetical protein CDAR_257531 [Caerostris darwini]
MTGNKALGLRALQSSDEDDACIKHCRGKDLMIDIQRLSFITSDDYEDIRLTPTTNKISPSCLWGFGELNTTIFAIVAHAS